MNTEKKIDARKKTPDQNKLRKPASKAPSKTKSATAGLSHHPDDNVDQDDQCITPAHAESAGLNSGAPCDDGRAGGK